MVVATVDRAQSEREIVRGDQSPRPVKRLACGVSLGNLDLIKNEVEIAAEIRNHAYLPAVIRTCRRPVGSVFDSRYGSMRSEEHTSELQSLMRSSYAVFCLKQKKNKHREHKEDQNEQK